MTAKWRCRLCGAFGFDGPAGWLDHREQAHGGVTHLSAQVEYAPTERVTFGFTARAAL